MFSTLVSGLEYCIQLNYYRTLAEIEKLLQSRSGPQKLIL